MTKEIPDSVASMLAAKANAMLASVQSLESPDRITVLSIALIHAAKKDGHSQEYLLEVIAALYEVVKP